MNDEEKEINKQLEIDITDEFYSCKNLPCFETPPKMKCTLLHYQQ